MAPAVEKSVVEPLTKPTIGLVEFWFGCIVNVLFITLLLADLSVIDFQQTPFTGQYFIWKSSAPYVKPIVLIISLTLPLAIIGGIISVVQCFSHKASIKRHLSDVFGFVALCAVVYNSVAKLQPIEDLFVAAAYKADVDELTKLVAPLRIAVLINLGLNVFMFILHIIKYHDQQPVVAPVVVVDTAKPKKD